MQCWSILLILHKINSGFIFNMLLKLNVLASKIGLFSSEFFGCFGNFMSFVRSHFPHLILHWFSCFFRIYFAFIFWLRYFLMWAVFMDGFFFAARIKSSHASMWDIYCVCVCVYEFNEYFSLLGFNLKTKILLHGKA